MVWELLVGFVVLVAASYVGTTMALRGFFGREYYAPPENGSDADAAADTDVIDDVDIIDDTDDG